MPQEPDFWTHGVATILESPELARVVQHRGDIGTVVEQEGNTSGWFHIPIPTPTFLPVPVGDARNHVLSFTLVGKVNDNAKVDIIHVRRGKDLIFGQSVSLVGKDLNEVVSTAIGASLRGGITLCVHVQFLTGTPRGRVEFYGAGAKF
jgi:hypothetical protein